MTLHVDYIDSFETKACDVNCDLAADAERVDIALAFLPSRGCLELPPSLIASVGRSVRLWAAVRPGS